MLDLSGISNESYILDFPFEVTQIRSFAATIVPIGSIYVARLDFIAHNSWHIMPDLSSLSSESSPVGFESTTMADGY